MKSQLIVVVLGMLAAAPGIAQDLRVLLINRETGALVVAAPRSGIVATTREGIRASGHLRIVNDSTLEIAGVYYPVDSFQSISTHTRQGQTAGGIMAGAGGALIAGGLLIGVVGAQGAGSSHDAIESSANWAITGVMAGIGLVAVIAGAKTASPRKFTMDKYELVIESR